MRPHGLATAVLALMILSACGGEKGKSATQVAAKVNKEEISVHQINFVLQRTPGITAENADTASRQILERLVTQELAVQQAQELKLDRNPNTVQAIEAARRDVLARAYIDSLGEGIAKATPEEVAKFYEEKPALFKNRRVYTFQEVSIAGTPAQMTEVQGKLTGMKSVQEFADYLKASGLRHGGNVVTQPSENLPLDQIDRFAAMNAGQAVFVPQPGGAKALLLLGVRSEPVDLAKATPAIEKFLLNDRKRIKTEADLKALRASAKVELLGKFAEAAASAPPVAAAPPPTEAASGTGLSAEELKKGLSGIK